MIRRKRQLDHLCPECLSTLELSVDGYKCTGNRLRLWVKEFEKYDLLTEGEKKMYIANLADKEKFVELYNSKTLECEYSPQMIEIIPEQSILIPDPMVVGKIELNFGRRLTDTELEEGFLFYRKGKNFSHEHLEGYNRFRIPRVLFPDDC